MANPPAAPAPNPRADAVPARRAGHRRGRREETRRLWHRQDSGPVRSTPRPPDPSGSTSWPGLLAGAALTLPSRRPRRMSRRRNGLRVTGLRVKRCDRARHDDNAHHCGWTGPEVQGDPAGPAGLVLPRAGDRRDAPDLPRRGQDVAGLRPTWREVRDQGRAVPGLRHVHRRGLGPASPRWCGMSIASPPGVPRNRVACDCCPGLPSTDCAADPQPDTEPDVTLGDR